jgi:pimeloyl-ACP methyl ester carboxylesterase
MPYLQINNTQIYYEDQGNGPETIIFSHGLLWSGYLFHNQIAILKNRYRCITFDFRGQGQSEVSQSGYDVESLYQDAVSIIETLDIGPCHFIGLSMGGFVGLRLAIRRSDLLKSLVILNSSPDPESKADERRYKMLSFVARWFGLGIVANRVMEIMFGKKFLKDPMRTDLKRDWKERMVTNDRIGITRAVSGVITREGVSDRLNQITVPTLIIAGDQDVAAVPDKAHVMQAGITNSELVIIPGAGHTSTIEEPEAVTAVLEKFLNIQKG